MFLFVVVEAEFMVCDVESDDGFVNGVDILEGFSCRNFNILSANVFPLIPEKKNSK